MIFTGYVAKEEHDDVTLDDAKIGTDITWVDCHQAGRGFVMYECFSIVMQTHKARPGASQFFLLSHISFVADKMHTSFERQVWPYSVTHTPVHLPLTRALLKLSVAASFLAVRVKIFCL